MTHTLSVRLPSSLYEEGRRLAADRHTSLNALIQEGLEVIVAEKKERQLFDAFGEAGKDIEENDVEFALHAQSEVIAE